MRQIKFLFLFLLIISPCFSFAASGSTLTPAAGGSAISAATAGIGGSGVYTSLTGPTITEGAVGNIKSGVITLSVPAGFEFDVDNPATVTITSNTANPTTNINHLASGTISPTVTTASYIAFTVTSQSTSARNTLTWNSIRIRPVLNDPLASGNLSLFSTNPILNLAMPVNAGVVNEVAAPITLSSISVTSPASKLVYTVGDSLNITGLIVTGIYSDSSNVPEPVTIANVTGFDSSAPVSGQVLTVSFGGQTTAYTVDIVDPLSSDKAISSFNFDSITASGSIDENTHAVSVVVPNGTDITALIPTISITGASVSPASGTPTDFTGPVVYTVTAADSSTVDYTVNVTIAAPVVPVIPAPIVVPDLTAPTITMNGLDDISLDFGSVYVDEGATAVDDIDANVTVESTGSVDTNIPGEYQIVYKAVDVAGNISTASRTVTVKPKKIIVPQQQLQPKIATVVEVVAPKEQIPVVPVVKKVESTQNSELRTPRKIIYLDGKSISTDSVNNSSAKSKTKNTNLLGASAADSVSNLNIWGGIKSFFRWVFHR